MKIILIIIINLIFFTFILVPQNEKNTVTG